MPHVFDFILVVYARANNFSVLLFVSSDRTARAISVSKFCFVTKEPLNYCIHDFIVWIKHEPLRLGVSF